MAFLLQRGRLGLLLLVIAGMAKAERPYHPLGWETCTTNDNWPVTVRAVTADLPALIGKDVTVKVLASFHQEMVGGSMHLDVKALGVKVGHQKYDLCTDLGLTCPVPPNKEVLATFRYRVPWWAVPAPASAVIHAFDHQKKQVLCVTAPDVPIARHDTITITTTTATATTTITATATTTTTATATTTKTSTSTTTTTNVNISEERQPPGMVEILSEVCCYE